MSFSDLGLSDALMRAVDDSGYNDPTPIQRQAIPSVLMGRDIIGIAQTGTGKTASFVLPMIDILAEGRSRALMPRSLILEPTRELAQQVAENFDKYGKYHKLNMALLIGGVSMGDQLAALEKGVDVLIATPGRLMDLFGRGKIMLNQCGLLVIDEADRMLDMGFIPDIEEICSKLPKVRQTLLFSATMPPPIKKLSDRFMSDPRTIEVARPASANLLITQYVVETSGRAKRETLRTLLDAEDVKTAIIFCNRKRDVRDLTEVLKRARLSVGQIHGDMEQSDRIRELDRFKNGDITILVASDVAARGLDIPGVSHVINYDVPYNADDYVHRIGRTGRAGRTGTAFTMATPEDAENLGEIEKLIRQKIALWTGSIPVAAVAAPVAEVATASAPVAEVAPEAAVAAEAAPRGDRRRRGRGGGAARPAAASRPAAAPKAEAAPKVQPATPARQPRAAPPMETAPTERRAEKAPPAPAPKAATAAPRHPPRPTARDPLGAYRQLAPQAPVRRRDEDEGESFIGFGPEGMPDFLRFKATME
ncbi:DEAD/DEAH box helicase [Sandarakinorhabdus sp.]|uniref:DEAD/DEAH box helicase n=1 Tax=Sandarakinorhabdus sp. TaxID=1916663 RepID=UPI00286D74E5|nr:DEAD/DEAH box helicase [Sandarakinorhabdus sp.]